jgi:hypothetical protein
MVDARLPEKGYSNSHGARPAHLIITMIKWIRTSRSSIKETLCMPKSVHAWKAFKWLGGASGRRERLVY